ncbi:hypothetical protein [Desulfogranum marinum]|uniref:hypothetical protein n=1 Tax=Desulfogranum marinum TaxID=453220 RepID=UPI0019659066|nr:hypothetical protein [Desulfogranum marinum]MBM9515292.1 hypothetical protein [Desulfogranum marinum]
MSWDWDWFEYVNKWNPGKTANLFALTPQKLKHVYNYLCLELEACDPLWQWAQLTQFVTVDERAKLKKDALLAETIRSAARMVSSLNKDIYEEEFPPPNEVLGTVINHIPELSIRKDVREYLEYVVNRFGLNPRPKLSLLVEGQTEEMAILKIFEEYYEVHPSILGIEIVVLTGVDLATGNKKDDRFSAIFRLLDYLHSNQTISFLILDNENYASKLKEAAKKVKSIHSQYRYVTRNDYIKIWRDSFEFDNFSCTEIASAFNAISKGRATFSVSDIRDCKENSNSGSALKQLYRVKCSYGLPKIEFNEELVKLMLSPQSNKKVSNREIVKVLDRVIKLANLNHFPVMKRIKDKNQRSKYLGKKV